MRSGAAAEIVRLLLLTKRLRNPGGCPWDAEQTHRSLTRYLLEETYEVVEALDGLPDPAAYTALEDELGDLLYQVVFHAVLAEEADEFTMADVARGIHDKLVRRHPHVFGDVVADETADVVRNWEQIKKDEKGATSIVEGITEGLPSLLYTNKLFRKAASLGLDPGSLDEALDRIDTAVARLRAGGPRPRSRSRAGARRRRRHRPRRQHRRRVRAARLGGALPPPLRGHGTARRRTRPRPRRPRPGRRRRPLARSRRHPLTEGGDTERQLPSLPTAGRRLSDRVSSLPLTALSEATGQNPSLCQVPRSMAGIVPMRPALKSSTAWMISSRRVHHERAVVHDGLADGEPAEQQHLERG